MRTTLGRELAEILGPGGEFNLDEVEAFLLLGAPVVLVVRARRQREDPGGTNSSARGGTCAGHPWA